jgi:hypothetical protein
VNDQTEPAFTEPRPHVLPPRGLIRITAEVRCCEPGCRAEMEKIGISRVDYNSMVEHLRESGWGCRQGLFVCPAHIAVTDLQP